MAPTPCLTEKLDDQLTLIFEKVCQLHNAPYIKYDEECEKLRKLIDQSSNTIDTLGKQMEDDVNRVVNEANIELYEQHVAQQRLADLEQRLAQYYPRSKVNFPAVQPTGTVLNPENENSFYAAEQVILQIADTSVGAGLKKLSGIWPSDNQAAGDLYLQIDKAMQKSKTLEKKIRDSAAAKQQKIIDDFKAFDAKDNAKLQQYDQRLREALAKANAQAMSKIRYTLSDPLLIKPLKQLIKETGPMMGSAEGWETYTPATEVPFEFMLGKALVSLEPGHFCSRRWLTTKTDPLTMRQEIGAEVEKNISFYNNKAGGFVMPWTGKRNFNILMFAETEKSISPTIGYFQDIVLRQLRFMPPKTNRFIYIDPVGLGARARQMINLTEAQGGCGACKVVVKSDEISDITAKLSKFVAQVRMTLTATNQVDIYNYNETVPAGKRIPYTTLVIHDFPKGFSAQAIHDLLTVMEQSNDCGFTILISHSKEVQMGDEARKFLEECRAKRALLELHFDQNDHCRLIDGGYNVPFKRIEVNPSDAFFQGFNAAYSYKPPIYNNLEHFFPVGKLPEWKPWSKELRFPFAVDSEGRLVDFCLDIDEKGYGLVTGSTGSGKTTLLHSVILGAAMHYHPEELEIWLADYKIAEFAPYGKTDRLPHIRYIVTDQSQMLIYSVIETVQKEIKRRADLFVDAGVPDYKHYRQAGYKLPKVLLIVDEFHRMSQALLNDQDYRKEIGNVISEARSHGINILFSDQSMAGMSGLKPDTQDLIRVRIAMKHVPQQVKETLALSESPDEKLAQQIKDLELSPQGGMLYKHAEPDPKYPPEENKKIMRFDSLRCLYASPEVRSAIIKEINAKVGQFDRELDVYNGPHRVPLDPETIKNFEKKNPVTRHEGERFYIGSPQGIGRCYYLNLKKGEIGENILLVGSQNEMRASLLKAAVRNARRHKLKTVILVPKFSMFYSKNKALLQDMDSLGCTVITAFGEICQYIGDYALSHRKAFPDTDDEVVMPENVERTLVICPAFDELFARMNKNASKSYAKALAEWKAELEAWEMRKNGKERDEPVIDPPVPEPEPAPNPLDDLARMIANMEKELNGEDSAEAPPQEERLLIDMVEQNFEFEPEPVPVDPPAEFTEPAPVFKGYNAIDDFRLLVEEGHKLTMHTMLLTDSPSTLKPVKSLLKLDGFFNHRIALPMASVMDFMVYSSDKVMTRINNEQDTNSAVYEYMSTPGRRFSPYL